MEMNLPALNASCIRKSLATGINVTPEKLISDEIIATLRIHGTLKKEVLYGMVTSKLGLTKEDPGIASIFALILRQLVKDGTIIRPNHGYYKA